MVDFFYSNSFEIFLIVMLAVFTVMLFTGHGSILLRTVKSNQKKRTPEQERYMAKHLGVVTLLWMVAEIVLTLFGSKGWVIGAYIVILAISMVYLAKFFKKYD